MISQSNRPPVGEQLSLTDIHYLGQIAAAFVTKELGEPQEILLAYRLPRTEQLWWVTSYDLPLELRAGRGSIVEN